MTTAQADRYHRSVLTIAKLETAQAKQDLAFSKHVGNDDGIRYFTTRIDRIAHAVSVLERGYITPSEALREILDAGD